MAYAGWLDALDPNTHEGDTEAAIRTDARLTPEKKRALLAVYRSLVTEPTADTATVADADDVAPAAGDVATAAGEPGSVSTDDD